MSQVPGQCSNNIIIDHIYANKAYNPYEIEDLLKEVEHIQLLATCKKNSQRALPPYGPFMRVTVYHSPTSGL